MQLFPTLFFATISEQLGGLLPFSPCLTEATCLFRASQSCPTVAFTLYFSTVPTPISPLPSTSSPFSLLPDFTPSQPLLVC
jgi:hypothetical protein